MSGDSRRYYLAVAASAISVVGWLGVAGFGLYAVYLSAVGGAIGRPVLGVLLSFVVGSLFAKAEKSLYRVEE